MSPFLKKFPVQSVLPHGLSHLLGNFRIFIPQILNKLAPTKPRCMKDFLFEDIINEIYIMIAYAEIYQSINEKELVTSYMLVVPFRFVEINYRESPRTVVGRIENSAI